VFASLVVEAIGAHLSLPKPLELPVYNSTDIAMAIAAPNAGHHVYPAFSSEFLLTFRKNGSIRNVEMTQTSLMSRLDDAIVAAIHAADSAQDFPPLTGVSDASTLQVFLDLDLGSGLLVTGFPLFRASVPLYPAKPVEMLGQVLPKYPEELRRSGRDGEARLRFVVDETGRVAKGSHRFVKLSEVPFGKSVVDVLPRLTFKPARIGSCPIKQIVEQLFHYRLDR
jgi:TonB family protein